MATKDFNLKSETESSEYGSAKGVLTYSPDIQVYSFEGKSGLFGTIASVVVGPVRLLLRVMHNIMILPANLIGEFANAVLLVSGLFGAIGVVDLIVFRKWPLLLSQIASAGIGLYFRQKAQHAEIVAMEKNEVHIDTSKVNELCNGIISELDEFVGKD